MAKNIIKTYDEYRKEGFAEDELWMIRKVQCMFNHWDYLTETEKERYAIMAKRLGI